MERSDALIESTVSEAVRWAAGGIPVEKGARVGCVLCVTGMPEDDAVIV